jgi:tetratricopeptide (TPR) repeat protein
MKEYTAMRKGSMVALAVLSLAVAGSAALAGPVALPCGRDPIEVSLFAATNLYYDDGSGVRLLREDGPKAVERVVHCKGLDFPAHDAALEKAKTFSAKATEEERLFIEARYAGMIERDADKWLRLLKELITKYPDDKDTHSELGQFFFSSNRYPEAIIEYEKALAIDPKYGFAINQLGYAYAGTGDFAKAARSFERYAELNPGLPNPVDSIAEINLFLGNLDAAGAKYREALAINPNFYASCAGLAYVYALKEDYGETGRWLEEFVKKAPTPQAQTEGLWLKNFYDYLLGRLDKSLAGFLSLRSQAEKFGFGPGVAFVDWIMGFLYTDRGEFNKSRASFQNWDDYEKANPSLLGFNAADHTFSRGWTELKQGRLEAVRGHLKEIESLLSSLSPADRADMTFSFSLLNAEAALAGNSEEQAISLGGKMTFGILRSVNAPTMAKYNTPFLKDVLARAYWKKGDLDKAIAEYERLTTIDPKNRLRMLIPPLYHYRFGRVLEEKGEKDKARLQYKKFLKYWADADPRFTELKDARARLAALRHAP